MAQVVNYYENGVVYTEGPFVCTNLGTTYRVEVQCVKPQHPGCPVLPDSSIYNLLDDEGFNTGHMNLKGCTKIVDFLNNLVREGKIVLSSDGWWEYIADQQ